MSDSQNKPSGDEKLSTNTATILAEKTVTDEDDDFLPYEPSVSTSVFVTWILPVLLIAIFTRFAVDKDVMASMTTLRHLPPRPVNIDLNSDPAPTSLSSLPSSSINLATTTKKKKKNKAPTPVPTLIADKPSSYIETVQAISRRRLDWEATDKGAVNPPSATTTIKDSGKPPTESSNSSSSSGSSNAKPAMKEPARGASSDPVRVQVKEKIDRLRVESQAEPDNLFKRIELADALRLYDVQYHDGGTAQEEAIQTYTAAIDLAQRIKRNKIKNGEETNRSLQGTIDIDGEIVMDYSERSIDGILCALHTAIGKVFFMSNMFEKAVESYSAALEIEPLYLDAMSARGSSRIILGKYEGAAQDFTTVMDNDRDLRFLDVFTGLARVLQARESAIPEGWSSMIQKLSNLISSLENQYARLADNHGAKTFFSNALSRLYHVQFLYHDVKTNKTDIAWSYLDKAYVHKMSTLPAWNAGFERQKIAATKQIFHRGFWPDGVGSQTKVPIFIIGFVRSGSTLTERVLDAHPQIVGTGENSVFNGQLDEIRNKIVETSMLGDAQALTDVISSLAEDVVEEMRQRWKMVSSGEDRGADELDPERYVDKMLTNYYNVGFIHMLFPNALILHVAREPMDTIFSAYKHEFPPGTLDYTSEFTALAELYHAYRDLMEHWDREVPGRVTHILYEDMVNDMPGVAKKIIEATGLDWDDSVLDFHKKKQAVNTLSTTQVRKGVYKDSLQAWKRYETHLEPLAKLIGRRTEYDLKTTLPGYIRPAVTVVDDSDASREESKATLLSREENAGSDEL